jgi:hypothetical protein
MRYLVIPQDILVTPWAEIRRANPLAAPEPISFARWVTMLVLDDPRGLADDKGTASYLQMRRWSRVVDKFEASKPGDVLEFDDIDHATLCRIVQSPSRMFQGGGNAIALACLPFAEAILDAPTERPAPEATATN